MSVYTQLNQNQLSELIKPFGFKQLQNFSEISDGIENSNYLLHADNNDWVLTIFENLPKAKLSPILNFMVLANQQGIALPLPQSNKQSQLLNEFNYQGVSKHYVLCKKLSGAHPKLTDINTPLLYELGSQFADIHALSSLPKALDGFKPVGLEIFTSHALTELELSKEKLQLISELEPVWNQLNKLLVKDATGICHCDFFPDNALVNNQSFTGFLDWYDAQYCYFILDLAVLAISWCVEGSQLNKHKLDALISGYQSKRILTQNELDALPDMIKLAAYNFWLSRERYHCEMKKLNRQTNVNKPREEFYHLLNNLL